jgi:transcriptional regulator with XRE-family HTH domain
MRRWLAQPGNSQAGLAKLLGWKQPTVHEVVRERAPRRIKLNEVQEIAGALALPLSTLLGQLPVDSRTDEELIAAVEFERAAYASLTKEIELSEEAARSRMVEANWHREHRVVVGVRLAQIESELQTRGF